MVVRRTVAQVMVLCKYGVVALLLGVPAVQGFKQALAINRNV